MVRDVDERIANWVASIVCRQFDRDLSRCSTAGMSHGSADSAQFRAGLATFYAAAA